MGRSPRAERCDTWTLAVERVPTTVFPRALGEAWYEHARLSLARYLPRHGSMLFRGFAVDAHAERQLLAVLGGTVTPNAADAWGHRVRGWSLVRCSQPDAETSLVDLRELYRALPGAARVRLVDRGLRFTRELPFERWRELFADVEAVEVWCGENDTSFEWLTNRALRLTRCEPAVERHAGGLCWNARMLRPSSAGSHIAHADGGAIDPHLLDELKHALGCVQTVVAWEPGDLLVLDRTLVASIDLWELEDSPGLSCTSLAVASHPNG